MVIKTRDCCIQGFNERKDAATTPPSGSAITTLRRMVFHLRFRASISESIGFLTIWFILLSPLIIGLGHKKHTKKANPYVKDWSKFRLKKGVILTYS